MIRYTLAWNKKKNFPRGAIICGSVEYVRSKNYGSAEKLRAVKVLLRRGKILQSAEEACANNIKVFFSNVSREYF